VSAEDNSLSLDEPLTLTLPMKLRDDCRTKLPLPRGETVGVRVKLRPTSKRAIAQNSCVPVFATFFPIALLSPSVATK
jgi:hypothetical protein